MRLCGVVVPSDVGGEPDDGLVDAAQQLGGAEQVGAALRSRGARGVARCRSVSSAPSISSSASLNASRVRIRQHQASGEHARRRPSAPPDPSVRGSILRFGVAPHRQDGDALLWARPEHASPFLGKIKIGALDTDTLDAFYAAENRIKCSMNLFAQHLAAP